MPLTQPLRSALLFVGVMGFCYGNLETRCASAQSSTLARAGKRAESAGLTALTNDGWRRTSHGWEQLKSLPETRGKFAPSRHLSIGQTWPAAWAACMLLSILSATKLSPIASTEKR